jgi:cation-transporting P-type ATPase F
MSYTVKKEDLLQELKSHHINGLSVIEAANRLKLYGQNIVKKQKKRSALVRLAAQFHNPLIYILLVSAIVALILGESVDASVIFGVVIVNAIIGYIQEGKAEKAIAALDEMMVTVASVVRSGKKEQIDARLLTIGDIVLIASGDKVPADMRLLEINNLHIDESVLTGESLPVQKEEKLLHHTTPLAERVNMAYAGSLVTYGQGYGVVTAIGDGTEIGQIAELLRETKKLVTPLLKKVSELGRLILIFVIGLSVLTFVIGILRGESVADMLMASVALAVGAIPEGLPAAMTIMLAIGVSAMAAKNAIIRTLPSVETLGCATVICSDKTGTLTKNEMTVQRLFVDDEFYDVSGIGYEGEGEVLLDSKRAQLHDRLLHLLSVGILCNDSGLKKEAGGHIAVGDPTEAALIVSAQKAGVEKEALEAQYPRIDSLPFESDRQFMATLHKAQGKNLLFVKGSAEKIRELCDGGVDALKAEEMASDGLRVLAFASKEVDSKSEKITDEMLYGLEFVGFQAMMDPPRDEAKKAVEVCKKAGIAVKMITGDHAATAKNIAVTLGICGEDGGVLIGAELEGMDDETLKAAVKNISVYARVSPQQKLRLVEALQANGEVVAMTGDGVNDAPALKRSDIGIAMGKGGTDVSKEAADMVLSDDNFASIVSAVEEGRNMYEKFIKFIVWTLPTNIGEGMVIFFAILLGVALPMLPVQVLWINMTTAVLLGLMLVFEPNEKEIMSRRPRRQSASIMSKQMLVRMLIVGCVMLIAAFWAFWYELSRGASEAYARTVAVTIFIVIESFYLFSCRSLQSPVFGMDFFGNKQLLIGVGIMAILQAAFIYLPFMNTLFESEPIGFWSLMYSVLAGVVSMLIVEGKKKWFVSRNGDI